MSDFCSAGSALSDVSVKTNGTQGVTDEFSDYFGATTPSLTPQLPLGVRGT